MSRCWVLVVVSWWSVLIAHSLQCETGVAFVDSILSVPRSLMANADVAVLKSYNASSVKQCMEDCCDGKYGACSVATFKKNTTTEDCILFNCRPLSKCKFLSSASTTSFSFSTNPTSTKPVPSDHHHPSFSSPPTPTHQPSTEEEIPVEQFALKNDNTTIKPRKGVDEPIPVDTLSKSGIKPRKGVSFEDVPHSKFLSNSQSKSNVKARKGVGPYSSTVRSSTSELQPSSSVIPDYSPTPTQHDYATPITDDLIADLAEILADDSDSSSVTSTSTVEVVGLTQTWLPTTLIQSTGAVLFSSVLSSSRDTPESSSSRAPPMRTSTLPVLRQTTLWPATTTVSESPVVSVTPTRHRPPVTQTLNAEYTRVEEQEVTMDKLVSTEEETENDRKYKSSIHLVLSLVFGLLVLFAVLGVVAKRVYDGWLRRDYYRMNYLIDGIYNGVD